jgi:hypothetical protein
MSRPTPRPEVSVIAGAVERPARKTSWRASSGDRASASGTGTSDFSIAEAADAGGVDAASVVRDLHQHLVSFPARPQPDTALLGLARRAALLGTLQAVIHRVADEMEERLLERVQDGAIELGAFALDLQEDSFPGLAAEVPHHP